MRKFDMRRPCENCPFRTDSTAIRFENIDRAKEIAWSAYLFGFPCHTTADYFEDDSDSYAEANSGFIFGDDTQHCAGYLIMQIKDSDGKTWPGIGHDQNLVARLQASLDFNSPVFNDLSSFYQANQSPYSTSHQDQGDADDQSRALTDDESRNLLQLGVNLLALEASQRHLEADDIRSRLGFDHCSAAIALANSVMEEELPPTTV